ncbi:MAG: ADP-forming succinate--CoA ligase subunit beta [Fimbriimonadaceae bacterium]|nr:ADP-forming succinate--CoA ligase subunit beta [Fimbriimonadaceae bacterium]
MKLHEYQSKDLFSKFGVPVTPGEVASDAEGALRAAQALGGKVVVKAQVLMGGRGKAGGVKLFDRPEDAAAFAGELIGKRLTSVQNPTGMVVEKVLVAQQIEIAEEYYVSILLDRAEQKLVVMCSKEGGMEIEEVAARDPQAIARLVVNPIWGVEDFEIRSLARRAKLPTNVVRQFVPMVKSLVKAYIESDAELIEVNPFALTTDGKLIAADAKVSIDDNSQFRHPEFRETADDAAENPLEAEAARQGIAYVHLGGDIGIIGNGAGLVMCSIDEVSAAGGKPANFLDVGGGAKADRVEKCVRLVLSDPNVKGLLINIFGGITRGEEVAHGILEAFEHLDVSIPVVARIEGTGAQEALNLLSGSKIVGATTMQEAAQRIVALAGA